MLNSLQQYYSFTVTDGFKSVKSGRRKLRKRGRRGAKEEWR